MKNCNPLKKVTPLFPISQQPLSQNRDLVKPPSPFQRGGRGGGWGGSHYGYDDGTHFAKNNFIKFIQKYFLK